MTEWNCTKDEAIGHHKDLNRKHPISSFFITGIFTRFDVGLSKAVFRLTGLQYHGLWAKLVTSLNLSSQHVSSSVVVGRPVARSVDLDLCLSWIKHCASRHPNCGKLKPKPFPARLIDVGNESGVEPKLIEMNGTNGHYVALSHCWGESRPSTPRSDTYHERVRSIPMLTLPNTFKDAVSVTRRLGFRFLWIDCLCVIQNDPDDWTKACSVMDRIYENPAFTIAALAASDADAGFLSFRPTPSIPSVTFSDLCGRILTVGLDYIGEFHGERHSPLWWRGWVVQERMLAPRTLTFGTHQAFLECRTSRFDESCCCPISEYYEFFQWHPPIKAEMVFVKTKPLDFVYEF